jgi:hypothetical protein
MSDRRSKNDHGYENDNRYGNDNRFESIEDLKAPIGTRTTTDPRTIVGIKATSDIQS